MGNKLEESDVVSLLNELCINDIHPESQSVWRYVTPTQKWEITNNKPDKINLVILLRLLLSYIHESVNSSHLLYLSLFYSLWAPWQFNPTCCGSFNFTSTGFTNSSICTKVYKPRVTKQRIIPLCGHVSLDLRYFAGCQRAAMCWLDLERTDEIS